MQSFGRNQKARVFSSETAGNPSCSPSPRCPGTCRPARLPQAGAWEAAGREVNAAKQRCCSYASVQVSERRDGCATREKTQPFTMIALFALAALWRAQARGQQRCGTAAASPPRRRRVPKRHARTTEEWRGLVAALDQSGGSRLGVAAYGVPEDCKNEKMLTWSMKCGNASHVA